MGLLQMSLYGTVMILVVMLIRTVAVNRLPKRTFIVLWSAVLVRLLIPFEIPSEFSVYSLLGSGATDIVERGSLTGDSSIIEIQMSEKKDVDERIQTPEIPYVDENIRQTVTPETDETLSDSNQGGVASGLTESKVLPVMTGLVSYVKKTVWSIIYAVGAILCAVYFIVAYVRCRIEFRMSLPAYDDYVKHWLEERRISESANGILFRFGRWRLRRLHSVINVKVSDRIDTPLTYGVIHPVILLPKKTAWEDREQLKYVLWHEYTHICYGDSVLKLFAAAALCVHWFNPLVWGMYFLLNRDIELTCDESVVHRCGVNDKSAYANMLIAMEAKRSGLVPLYNNFSQNAIEERVRAIMKIKKISFGAVIFAAGLVVGVTTAFATSAGNKEEYVLPEREIDEIAQVEKKTDGLMTQLSEEGGNIDVAFSDVTNQVNSLDEGLDRDYTQDEWNLLNVAQFEGYEDMTVAEFRDKANTLIDDSWENLELLERFTNDEALYRVRDLDETAFFLFYVLSPLSAEQWQTHEFGDYVSVGHPYASENVTSDRATLEYGIIVTVLDADELKVRDYVDIRLETADRISNMLSDYAGEELADEELMQEEIERLMRELTAELSTEEVSVDVNWYYQPLDPFYVDGGYWDEEERIHDEYQKERKEQWEEILKPYLPFGLTCEYDAQADECKMYFKGKEVRGLIDENTGTWISEHAGIGLNVYAQDAIEVYAVYDEDGNLTGLRAATKEEREEWSVRRRQTTDELYNEVQEVREYLPGTSEDYDLLLSLKKSNYKKMSLADFDSALLDWANENYDSYDRIECDRVWNDFRVDLSEEDKEFVTCTVGLSGIENAMVVRSLHQGKSEEEAEDVSIGDTLTKNPGAEAPQYTWCQMYYVFSYYVKDKEKVTVGERDRTVGGMLDGIEDFWEETDIEELLKMDKNDIIKKLNELAAKYSTRNITITVAEEDRIGFECYDERSLMMER